MNIRRLLSGVLAGVLASTTAWPCSSDTPNTTYIVFGNEADVLLMPKASFKSEMRRILGLEATEDSKTEYYNAEEPWDHTLEGDIASLGAALNESQLDAGRIHELMSEYRALRKAMQAGATLPPVYPDDAADLPNFYTPKPDRKAPASTLMPVDLAAHTPLLSALPKEFALYVRGAALYRIKDYAAARAQWEAVLALPEAERKYRATWAAYMLAKASIHSNADAAAKYFDEVRTLAQSGADDRLHLADESYGWQARIAFDRGDIVTSIERYNEMAKSPNQAYSFSAQNSLNRVLGKALKSPEMTQQMAAAPLSRKLATAWLVGNRRFARDRRVAWLDAVAALKQSAPVEDADQLAWIAYDSGEMQRAEDWIKLANPAAPYAQWVQSKVFLRAGKIDKAIAMLRRAKDAFPKLQAPDTDYRGQKPPHLMTQGELGVLMLGRQDYVTALDLFMRSGYWMDAAYVAERVLTSKELSAYLNAPAPDAELIEATDQSELANAQKSRREDLILLLARKLAREEKWDEALALFPDSKRELPAEFAASYRLGIGSGQPGLIKLRSTQAATKRTLDPERANHLFTAAKLMHEHGLDIIGMELDPDWVALGAMYGALWKSEDRFNKPPSPAEEDYRTRERKLDGVDPATFTPALKTALSTSADERKRVKATRANHQTRFHFRHTAADLMWASAELSPNNDLFTEQALYWGGTYIKYSDPKAADSFYKALVRRNPKMPYAQEADRLRWFPKVPPE